MSDTRIPSPPMSEQPEPPVQRIRNTEYRTFPDGVQSKRKVNPDGTRTAWVPVSPSLRPGPEPHTLNLVLENQAEGEPKHWFLFVGPEDGLGTVYQVAGDATFMRYESFEVSSLLRSESYHTSYVLARLAVSQEDVLRSCAEGEAPPCAVDRASVTENCQGWTIRVLRRLHDAEVVGGEWVTFAEGLEEPA